jgi:hypothetical protein
VSTGLVMSEISAFLASTTPEVLCLRGVWGVGKTYTWTNCVQKARQQNKLGLSQYAYVSLFGLASLQDLKYAMFEETIRTSDNSDGSSAETFWNKLSWIESKGRKALQFAQASIVRRYLPPVETLAFAGVRKQIICIDDLERHSKSLSLKDVLGLSAFLRDQRSCKVMLLLNEKEFEEDDRKVFDTYLEKTVDRNLVFSPTASEVMQAALPSSDPHSKGIARRSVQLNISNIRVVRAILAAMHRLSPMLEGYDELIVEQAKSTLVLLMWMRLQPNQAPSLEFIQNRRNRYRPGNQEQLDPKEAVWVALLEGYGFSVIDKLDQAILDGIDNGFFNPDKVSQAANELNSNLVARRAEKAFANAWDMYRDSFDDNADQVLDAMYKSFEENYPYISPLNLNSTIRLFKELDRPDVAREMITTYVNNRNEDRKFFDLERNHFLKEDLTDGDLILAFREKANSLAIQRDLYDLLIASLENFDNEILDPIADSTVDDFVELFRSKKGVELKRAIQASLQFMRISNASDTMRRISEKAQAALSEIGASSALNRLRVERFGILATHDQDID